MTKAIAQPLQHFAPPVRHWFQQALGEPTRVQAEGWHALADGSSALLLAPTGSGKTLAAFLTALDRLMFGPAAASNHEGVRVLYISPLKALGVDVERNLRAPLVGISAAAEWLAHQQPASARSALARPVRIAQRTGDTPPKERARFKRDASDILITTPESLYLLLTSQAASQLVSVETVIVDEVHALVGTKRGAHLALSLERLERLRLASNSRPLQRIGLSATVQLVEEAQAFLGGMRPGRAGNFEPRPVRVVAASAPPRLSLRVAVPVVSMGEAIAQSAERSLWPSLHAPLLDLIRSHHSTLLFVNNRRLAERLSAALNEAAGETLVFAHHGSIAKDRRLEIEESLKQGRLKALVATSSLELGIDMGAIDLVVQIETPPSVAAGLQRVGRAGHHVGGESKGVIFPKFRGDLLAAATTAERMRAAAVEAVRMPRNPLDVLAQQIVAIVAEQAISEEELYHLARGAAPFATLPRRAFEGVLDLLSGRYPSEEFAELRPRLVWDRTGGQLTTRLGARHVAIVNAGTIPDRGLYGVFLADGGDKGSTSKRSVRVGELDEEMVFESRVGEIFLLGASSWRIEDITADRVLVTPAPGQPGKMPFWHGDRIGRPLELGLAIGRTSRELLALPERAQRERLSMQGLDDKATSNLLEYLQEQREATGEVPSDRQLIVEQFQDELGDHRVCVLSPLGTRVHAPWALAAMELQREALGIESEAVWTDEGIIFRFPEHAPPEQLDLLIPASGELDRLLQRSLAVSSLFAARFRENAARALLLPRRRPGERAPLWAQRRRAADLLRAAAKYPDFPIIVETFRECLADVFDVPGLRQTLSLIEQKQVRVTRVVRRTPSPFAAALTFSYVGNFMYTGDAPLAERRAHALSVDPAQLRALLGEAEQRELLDLESILEVEREAQRRHMALRHPDQLHHLLLALGDLGADELRSRAASTDELDGWLGTLERTSRVVQVRIGGSPRWIAAEDASRYQDALGVVLPRALPAAFLEPHPNPLAELVSRHARTHGPFTLQTLAERYPLAPARLQACLEELAKSGRLTQGYFLPSSATPQARSPGELEWCDSTILARIKTRTLARLRSQVEPVPAATYARFCLAWQGVLEPRGGPDALTEVLEQLEGYPLLFSTLETEVLPARVRDYGPEDLDDLTLGGEWLWRAIEPVGATDARIAFYRSDRFARLSPTPTPATGQLPDRVRELLAQQGASFFAELSTRTRAFAPELLEALWVLLLAGEVTNDTLSPLRARLGHKHARLKRSSTRHRPRRARALVPPGGEGRWSLLERSRPQPAPSSTECLKARTEVLLSRYGVVTREATQGEHFGPFSELYKVLKFMEEAGHVRRGYFVAGLGATQFARPGADDRLRALREPPDSPEVLVIGAADPANPFGAVLPWPEGTERPARTSGALVLIVDGNLLGYLGRGDKTLITFLPTDSAARHSAAQVLAKALARLVDGRRRRALMLTTIDGATALESPLGPALLAAGFTRVGTSYVLRPRPQREDAAGA